MSNFFVLSVLDFFLSSTLNNLSMMCLGVNLFVFILLACFCAFWMFNVFCQILEVFFAIFSSNIFYVFFLSCSSRPPITSILIFFHRVFSSVNIFTVFIFTLYFCLNNFYWMILKFTDSFSFFSNLPLGLSSKFVISTINLKSRISVFALYNSYIFIDKFYSLIHYYHTCIFFKYFLLLVLIKFSLKPLSNSNFLGHSLTVSLDCFFFFFF